MPFAKKILFGRWQTGNPRWTAIACCLVVCAGACDSRVRPHDVKIDAAIPVDGTPTADGGADCDGETAADSTLPPDGAQPRVEILEPADDTVVENPVLFRIGHTNVASVELFADGYSLAPAWDPNSNDTLDYDFTGVGYARSILLLGYDAQQQEVASDTISITVVEPDIGDYLGEMWNTYYYLASELDYSGSDDTTLYDETCTPIAEVPHAYSDDVCIEGSGILEDGRVINYATTCSCGRTCPTGGIICYVELDPQLFPYGMGSMGNALEPLRSWAVDNTLIAAGTVLYAEQWDGVDIPLIDGLGGFVHDGCFRADDVGGWIQGYHFDFFAGTYDMYMALEAIHPTSSDFDVYETPGKCAYLAP
jgi:3D (Asp-Asp-Asp) domain-containing protein